MGQIFCKNCEDKYKKSAFAATTTTTTSSRATSTRATTTSNTSDERSSGGDGSRGSGGGGLGGGAGASTSSDPKRSNRIKHKKRKVALHAEFRDRQGINNDPHQLQQHHQQQHNMHHEHEITNHILLAPPLVTETLMEDTDNVFSGHCLGVDTFHNSGANSASGASVGRSGSALTSSSIFSVLENNNGSIIPQDRESGNGGGGGYCSRSSSIDSRGMMAGGEEDNGKQHHQQQYQHHQHQQQQDQQHTKFKKTAEEDAFLDQALSDDDNFVFDGLTMHVRQRLKDSMERVDVPKNTMLIKKGDNPDYLYLVLEGEIAVYIDPNEYIDENAVEIGKHAPIDITVPHSSSSSNCWKGGGRGSTSTSTTNTSTTTTTSTTKREFKQSYVLQLRKSLFQSSYNEKIPVGGGDNSNNSNNNKYDYESVNGGYNTNTTTNKNNDNILGRVLSVVRQSFSNPDSRTPSTTLNGISEEEAEEEASTTTSPGSCIIEDDNNHIPNLHELIRGLKHERDLSTGDVLGELGLLYNTPRTASCLTTTRCVFYRIEGELFRSILSSSNSDRARKRYTESRAAIEALYNIGVFSSKDEMAVLQDTLGSVLNPVTFDQDDLVITKGAHDEMMFFVMAGKLLAHDIGTGDSTKADVELSEGGHFGELNLLTGGGSIANVTVLTPKARLMAVTKKDYRKRRESLEPLMKKLWLRNALLTIPTIAKSKLFPHEINSLLHKLESIVFPAGNICFTGDMKSAVYIVETGKIQMAELTDSDGLVHTFHPQDHFGARSLFDGKFFERKSMQVRAILPSKCMMLTHGAIVNVIGKIDRLGKPMLPVSRKLIKGMKESDLKLHRIIGVGNFGRVWLVQHKTSSTVYALKVMDKKEIIQRKMIKGVTREKNVMASVEHPFISNLVSTFQDKSSIYMLMSYVQGGELFGLIYNISKKGHLSNDAAAFYGACLVEALSHLHSRNICHRDLKPENVLINAAGYVVLIDFGFAKVVLDKTFTMCGSPEYMAPEILLGKGHSHSVDHWALGVLLYEMLVGQTPFIHVGATRVTLFRRICSGSFAFPNPDKHGIVINDNAKKFVRGLLNKNSDERTGSSLKSGEEGIRKNAWFQGLLTEYKNAFLSQKVSPPWLPDIDDELDASYFGSHDNVEKEVMSKSKKQQEALKREYQDLFKDFGCECNSR